MLLRRALFAFLLLPIMAHAETAHVVVAANFTDPARDIAAAFKRKSGSDVTLSFGTSGNLAAQIMQGAPFDVMLSADEVRPTQLIAAKLAVAGSNFTYAVGKLVLWSHTDGIVSTEAALKAGTFNKLAIAKPEAAPYGVAAVETLKSLKLYDKLEPKIVQGGSVAQAFQFIDTGNAELGFVALSQVINNNSGSRWLVPQELYTPIRQDAVLLRQGEGNAAAKAFLEFLKGPEAHAIIEKYGYSVVPVATKPGA
jgi:molybdate transport system substrate-binding protein